MSIAAYQFCSQVQNKNVNFIYSSRDGLVNILDKTKPIHPIKIKMEDYFKVYGWNIQMQKGIKKDLNALTEILSTRTNTTHSLLYKLRQGRRNGKRIDFSDSLPKSELSLLKEIATVGFVTNIIQAADSISCTIPDNEKSKFLFGTWLEYLVYQQAVSLNIFDECAWNVEDSDSKGELDFVGLYEGQLIIASCKTEEKIKTKIIKN